MSLYSARKIKSDESEVAPYAVIETWVICRELAHDPRTLYTFDAAITSNTPQARSVISRMVRYRDDWGRVNRNIIWRV